MSMYLVKPLDKSSHMADNKVDVPAEQQSIAHSRRASELRTIEAHEAGSRAEDWWIGDPYGQDLFISSIPLDEDGRSNSTALKLW